MSHSKCVVPWGTSERERNDGESRAIFNLSGINNRSEAVDHEFRGASKGVKREDRPGKAPRGEACVGASLKPVKARSYEMVRRFIQ